MSANRGFRGYRPQSRGRGRGRGRGVTTGPTSFRLEYASLEDTVIDPLQGFATPRGGFSRPHSGRGQQRNASNNASGPRRYQQGLGYALQDISNAEYNGSRALLQPVKFVRGEGQELMKDPDTVLLQPGVHDDHHRRSEHSPPTPAASLPVASISALPEPAAPAFVVDLVGDKDLPAKASTVKAKPFLEAASAAEQTVTDDDDEEEIVYVPPSQQPQKPSAAPSPPVSAQPSRPASRGPPAPVAASVVAAASTQASPPPAELPPIPSLPGKSAAASRKAVKRAIKRGKKRAQEDAAPRMGDSDVEWGSDGPPQVSVDDISASLKERVIHDEDEEDGMDIDEDLQDSSFAVSFVKSMAANAHVSADDIAIEQALRELDAEGVPWRTDSDGSSASDAESIIQRVEDERWNDDGSDAEAKGLREVAGSDDSDDSSVDSDDAREAIEAEEDDDSSEDDDDDDDLLVGRWDDADVMLDAHPDLLTKGSRAQKKKLFKAIQQGDFSAFDEDEDFALQPVKKKGKGKMPKFNLPGVDSDDEFMHSLQQQWQADRASKASRKKARAIARAEAGPSKKELKKAKRRTGDASDALRELDINVIHDRIRGFAIDVSAGQSLGLPPLNKRQRVAVHLLALEYGLISKSVGKGANRAPILQRTARTAVHGVPARKIQSIISASEGKVGSKEKHTGKSGGLWKFLDGSQDKAKASPVAKNREGGLVGHGATALDEGNVGFRLLARMGWAAGERIGVSGGLDVPLQATIKTTKRGLGH